MKSQVREILVEFLQSSGRCRSCATRSTRKRWLKNNWSTVAKFTLFANSCVCLDFACCYDGV